MSRLRSRAWLSLSALILCLALPIAPALAQGTDLGDTATGFFTDLQGILQGVADDHLLA